MTEGENSMTTRLVAPCIATGVVLAIIGLTVPFAVAQFPVPGYEGKNPIGPDRRVINRTEIPRLADGHPNFTGVWAGPGFSHKVGLDDTDNPGVARYDQKLFPPFVPGGEKLFYQPDTGDLLHDDPTALCLPDGYPREALTGYPTEIIHVPGFMIWRYEYMHFDKVVPTDGRPHPKNVELTFMGDSVARWEGDTLVLDTIGLKAWPIDASASPSHWHSDALHVIDRIRYIDPMTAEWVETIDDPKIFTRPFSVTFQMKLHPTWTILEQICEENNRCMGGTCTASDAQKTSK
jgi:hypothetical protein